MKSTKLLSFALIASYLLLSQESCCADHTKLNKLDLIIPSDRALAYLQLLPARDTPTPSTATPQSPSSWTGMGLAVVHHVSKNYTEAGLVEYVTNPDNPDFFRLLAGHAEKSTPIEQQMGQHTLKEHLKRANERSNKSQLLIIELLEKKDLHGAPTKDGAETMLKTLDTCRLAIADLFLLYAKAYLKRYTAAFGEQALFNENIMKELKFIPALLQHMESQHVNVSRELSLQQCTSPISHTSPAAQTLSSPPSSSPIAINHQQPYPPQPQTHSHTDSYPPVIHCLHSPCCLRSQGSCEFSTSSGSGPITLPEQTPPREALQVSGDEK